MKVQIKHILRFAVVLTIGLILAGGVSSCKANKCDCPTFGGHRL